MKSPMEISSSTYESINLWSTPSYLPQTRVIFDRVDNSITLFWFNFWPCGERYITFPKLSLGMSSVNKNGEVVKRFAPKDGGAAIEAELKKVI